MDVLPNTIYAREAFLHISVQAMDLQKIYVPFVDVTETLARTESVRKIGPQPELYRK